MSTRFANTLSSLSFLVAVGSAFYTGMTNWRNQENISILLTRDYYAGLEDAQPSMIVKDQEAPNGLKARYIALISNTSNTTSVSIINMNLTVTKFTGWGIIQIPSPYRKSDGTDNFRIASTHQNIVYPIKLSAGETVEVEFSPVITVDPKYGAQVTGGLPHHDDGSFSGFGFKEHDMFGNIGEESFPNNFISRDIANFKQPHIQLRATSGRGFTYEGSADWYPKVYKQQSAK